MKIIAALLLCLTVGAAQAKVITYTFTGVFQAPTRWTDSDDPNHAAIFNGLLKEGDRFSGQFSFDNEAIPLGERNPQTKLMFYPLLSFHLAASEAFNTAVPAWDTGSIEIINDYWDSRDTYNDRLVADGRKVLDSQHALSASIDLRADAAAFDDFRVPQGFQNFMNAYLDLNLYHYDHFTWDYVDSRNVEIKLLQVNAVPEPGTILLLLAGLSGLTLLRRRV